LSGKIILTIKDYEKLIRSKIDSPHKNLEEQRGMDEQEWRQEGYHQQKNCSSMAYKLLLTFFL
jgi:hypothetical protein